MALEPYRHHPEHGPLLVDPDEIERAVTNSARIVNNLGIVHIAMVAPSSIPVKVRPHLTPMAGVGVTEEMGVVFWSYNDSPHTEYLRQTARAAGTIAMTLMLHHKYLQPHEEGEMDVGYVRMLDMHCQELPVNGVLRYLNIFNEARRRSHIEERDLDEFVVKGQHTRKRLFLASPARTDEARDVGITYPISAYADGPFPKQYHLQHPLTSEEIWQRAYELRRQRPAAE